MDDAAHGRPLTPMTWLSAPKSASCPAHYSAADYEACNESFLPAFVEGKYMFLPQQIMKMT